jgi:conjugal transfer/entry exclusion protein
MTLEVEIQEIQTQIQALQTEREAIAVPTVRIEDRSPQAIADAYRSQAQAESQVWAQLKGIENAIAALDDRLKRKQAQLRQKRQQTPIEQQVEEAREQAKARADRINQLAEELGAEVKALKAIADDIAPMYWRVYCKPFINGFSRIYVPHVTTSNPVWKIFNRSL